MQEIARRRAQRGDAEVAHHHDLAVGVAAGDRYDGGAEGLGAVVRAQPTGEQAVAEGVLHHVAAVQPAGCEGARHHLGPDVHVLARVGDDDRLAGGAGRRVQAHDVAHGAREQAEGVGVAQVALDREGQPGDVLEPLDRVGREATLLEAGAEEGDPLVGAGDDGLEPAQLHLLESLLRQEIGCAGGVEPPGRVVPELGQHGRCPSSCASSGCAGAARHRGAAEREGLLVDLVQLLREVGVDGRDPVLLGYVQRGRERAQQRHVEALAVLQRARLQDVGADQQAARLQHGAVDLQLGLFEHQQHVGLARPAPSGSAPRRRSGRRCSPTRRAGSCRAARSSSRRGRRGMPRRRGCRRP